MSDKLTPSKATSKALVAGGGLSHIAFIMDGNGRWAEKHGMPRRFGHSYGASNFKKIISYCGDIGITTITVYAFSTENWNRPAEEVNSIMKLIGDYMDECERDAQKKNLKIRFIGNLSVLSEELQNKAARVEKMTSDNGLSLNVALNYGGRDELVHAFNKLIADGRQNVTEEDISSALYTYGQKDPDLIFRTAGEFRLSNFLLWQAAYSEFYSTEVLWPDLSPRDIDKAVIDFFGRKRKFGKV